MSALQELDASPLGPVCIHKNRRLSQNVTINLQYTLSGKKKIWRESKFRNMYFCIQQANTSVAGGLGMRLSVAGGLGMRLSAAGGLGMRLSPASVPYIADWLFKNATCPIRFVESW